jgi:[FeFe] hydrogenase H-cluster maturation GTPase HydF
MQNTPKGLRLHIGIYGRRNVGKSSLLNAMTQQQTSIVSPTAGTTTDPVEKPMELLPIGPVLFIDTAGIDDIGALGQQRIEKTRKTLHRTDLALIVTDTPDWGAFESQLAQECQQRNIPILAVFNKSDLYAPPAPGTFALPAVSVSAQSPEACRRLLRDALIPVLPDDFLQQPAIAGDLVKPGDVVVLVVPIDLEAPRGRLILPQVQTIRDLLDHDACALVAKERELRAVLDKLKQPPALVVTDSQAFLKVDADTPPDVRLTSFSILFARIKGDLQTFVRGAQAIDNLHTNDRILIAEACTHHQIGDDIGRTKIPRWLAQYTGGKLQVDHVQGNDFPTDVSPYKLVIHCGSCTFNRRHLLTRITQCEAAGVPITNYGITIAKSLGILKRALSPFPQYTA